MFKAEVLADSLHPNGSRATTMLWTFPRIILPEVLTHRTHCLAGDARLDFDLPCHEKNRKARRHPMTIREFVDKWENGAAEHLAPRHNGVFLQLDHYRMYTSHEVAGVLKHTSAMNLNAYCRQGRIGQCKKIGRTWWAPGHAWMKWRDTGCTRRFSIRERLSNMLIRQIDEGTGEIQRASVRNAFRSGVKRVFVVSTLNYEVAGSEDHLVFTENGWSRIGDLKPGKDRLCVYKYGTGRKEDPYKKIDGRWVAPWNRSIRKEVAARQNGLCAHSGKPLGSDFHIHHIKPRHQRPDLAFDMDNVVAVTPEAHADLHGIQGWQTGANAKLVTGFEVVRSIKLRGKEETFDLEIDGEFPNFFANGVVVHNSRNTASSRAIPALKAIERVEQDPFIPIHFGKNQKGMQAGEEITGEDRDECVDIWLTAARAAIYHARNLHEKGVHKQIVNRIIEPYSWTTMILTACGSGWRNLLALRCHPAAEPHFQKIAFMARDAYNASTPKELAIWEWHLPLVGFSGDESIFPGDLIKVSVGRCARVSYLTHDGRRDPEEDIRLHDRLMNENPKHMSAFEHQLQCASGYPLSDDYRGNMETGWIQYRKQIIGERAD